MKTLLERAQAAGAVRKDVGWHELMALVTGAFASIDSLGGGPQARERLLAIVSDGLRGPAAPQPGKPRLPARPVRIRMVGGRPSV